MEKNSQVLKNINPPSRMVWEVQKLFCRNFKLMSSITLLMICITFALDFSKKICIEVPFKSFASKASMLQLYNPNSTEFTNVLYKMKNDLELFAGIEVIFFCASAFVSLFFITSSIIGSAVSYCKIDLSTKQLLCRAMRSLKRTFVTWFYIKLLDLGVCLSIALLILLSVLLFHSTLIILAFALILIIVALFFRTYLAVVWNLALVVSVLEDKCGLQALGKAGQLIKGSTRRGFLLNLVGGICISVLSGLATIVTVSVPAIARMIPLMLSSSIICFIMMFLLMAYTVLYYESKEAHGEKLEMQGSMEYIKVPFSDEFTPLILTDAEAP